MKKIGLIDVDHHNFPNIALMKISAWHKQLGNSVEWYTPFEHYDIVYLSKVFSFSEDYKYPIYADHIIYGGTGYQIKNTDILLSKSVYFLLLFQLDNPPPARMLKKCFES